MRLVKTLHSNDLPSVRGTLKVGSLEHYKHLEQAHLRDPGEGQLTIRSEDFGPVILTKEACYALFNHKDNASSPLDTANGAVMLNTPHGLTVAPVGENMHLTGSFYFNFIHSNALVFCMSEEGEKLSSEYGEASWSMQLDDRQRFAEVLMANIFKCLEMQDIVARIVEGSATFYMRIQKVTYHDRQMLLRSNTTEPYTLKHFNFLNAAFFKPRIERFVAEREHRFVFGFRHARGTPKIEVPEVVFPTDHGLTEFITEYTPE